MNPPKFLVATYLTAAALTAAESGHVWKSSELSGFEQKLSGKKVGGQSLVRWANYNAGINHREATGEAEVHEHVVDFLLIRTGEATIVLGGKVQNPKTTAPGETRGSGIDGGDKQKVGPGDIIHVPANTPHQFLLDAGKQITYTAIKIQQSGTSK
jgi:mannose-6-phosphate isomerase-like protein (cupin superfamily)